MQAPRRIVIGENKHGRSVVFSDGEPENRAIGRVAQLWTTYQAPATDSGAVDASLGKIEMNPPSGGSIFRYIELPPETGELSAEQEVLKSVAVDTSRHPLMHKTGSLDYVVVLSGKVSLMLDDEEVDLNPHDVVVQCGANHAWVNKGSEPVRILAVMLDAAYGAGQGE